MTVRETKHLDVVKKDFSVSTGLSAGSDVPQVLSSEDPKLGSVQLVIPPGSLLLDTQMEVSQGVDMSSQATLSSLGLSETTKVSSAGSPVVLRSSVPMDLSTPMQLFLAMPDSANLTSGSCHLGIIYLMEFVNAGKYEQGIYSPEDSNVSIQGDKIVLSTSHFGAYQSACFSDPIPAHVNETVEHPPATQEEQISSNLSLSISVLKNSKSTSLNVKIKPVNFKNLSICRVSFSQDKNIFNSTISTSLTSLDWVSTYTTATDVYVQAVCVDSNGLSAASDWMGPLSVAANMTTNTTTTTFNTGTSTNTATSTGTGTGTNSNTTTTIVSTVAVESVYPLHGNNWNDYILNSSISQDKNHQSDSSCSGSETDLDGCIHGGERKKVKTTFLSTCANAIAVDELGWYNWTCQIENGKAVFYSNELNFKTMSYLLNGSVWQNNRVSIYKDAVLVGRSSFSPWWSNPITILSSTTTNTTTTLTEVSLTESGKVYVLQDTFRTGGLNIAADKISLVMYDHDVYYQGISNSLSSYPNAPTGSSSVIKANDKKFIWIEGGDIKSFGLYENLIAKGVSLQNVKFSKFNRIKVNGTNYDAFYLNSVEYSSFLNIEAYGCRYLDYQYYYPCINLVDSSSNFFENTKIADSNHRGLGLDSTSNFNRFYFTSVANVLDDCIFINSDGNIFYETFVSQCSNNGLQISGTAGIRNVTDNIVVGFQEAGSANGLKLYMASKSTIRDVTVGYNSSVGIYVMESDHNVIINSLAYNNYYAYNIAAYVNYYNANLFYNLAMSNNVYGLQSFLYPSFVQNSFNGFFLGATNGCSLSGGASNHGIDGSCSGPNLIPVSTDLVLWDQYLDITESDITNQANMDSTNHEAQFNDIHGSDWVSFDNLYRLWLRSSAGGVGKGRFTSDGAGKIFDWRPLNSSPLVGTSLNGAPNPSFTPGGSCPAFVSTYLMDYQTIPKILLVFAREILDFPNGNKNGLCETGEYCTVVQNWGAYQGSGDYNSNYCNFTSMGGVYGATLFDYPAKGM